MSAAPPPPSYKLVPARRSDIPALVRLDFDAYADDAIHRLLHSIPATPAMIDFRCAKMADAWGKNPHEYVYDLVHAETGALAASVEWEFVAETKTWGWTPPTLGADWHRERFEAVQKAHVTRMGELMGGKTFMFLTSLSTATAHRRRGLATALLHHAIAAAAAANLDIVLTASPLGKPLYLANGFAPHATFTIDLPDGSLHQTGHFLLHPAPLPASQKPPQIPSPLARIAVAETLDSADYNHVVRLEEACMRSDPIINIIFQAPSDFDAAQAQRAQMYAAGMGRGRHRLTLATDTLTGEVVGVAQWEFVDAEDPASRVDAPYDPDKWGNGTVKEMANELFGALYTERVNAMRGRRYIYLHILDVEPGWQRIGLGGKLLEWGLNIADERGLPCWVDSSKVGEGLYRKMGWVVQGVVEVDEGAWGVQGRRHPTFYMLREPRPRRGREDGGGGGGEMMRMA